MCVCCFVVVAAACCCHYYKRSYIYFFLSRWLVSFQFAVFHHKTHVAWFWSGACLCLILCVSLINGWCVTIEEIVMIFRFVHEHTLWYLYGIANAKIILFSICIYNAQYTTPTQQSAEIVMLKWTTTTTTNRRSRRGTGRINALETYDEIEWDFETSKWLTKSIISIAINYCPAL